MVKRIGLIPLFPFCFFLAFIAGTGRGEPTNSSTDIGQAKTHIMSLIESGDYTKAKEAVDKLADDFPDEPQLAQTLHAFTEKYEYARRFEEAKHVYQKIIQKFPNSSYANRARLGVIREDVMFFIASQNYDGAKQTLDKMVANFAGHKDLPDTLYWIAERYEWEYRFEDANRIYQQVIQRYPDSSWAAKAKLGISRAQVMSLINSQNYDLAGEALNKLSTDFTGNQDLPQTLYWIAERYKWSGTPEESKRVCLQIVQKYPDSPWADKAKLGISRGDFVSIVTSQDYAQVQKAIDKLVADFKEHPDLPETLYWIAEKYKWSFNFTQAKQVYQLLIQKYPNCSWVALAKSGISSSDVTSAVISQNYDRPEETVDKLVSDFAGNPDLPRAILIVGEQCYRQGLAKKKEGLVDEANKHCEKAMGIWNEFIKKLPDSNMAPEMCAWLGDACTELGRYDEAIAYYKKARDSFYRFPVASRPDDTFLWHSLFMTGQSYEKLKEAGSIPADQADPAIIAAYEQLVQDFGSCPLAKDAWRRLGFLYAKNNQWSQTAGCFEAYLKLIPEVRCPPEVFYNLARAYDEMGRRDSAKRTYTMFIKSVMPNDPRRKEAKERLAKLSEAD